MPCDMRIDWIAPDGTARIQVFPKVHSNSHKSLRPFSDRVLGVAPQATGCADLHRGIRQDHRRAPSRRRASCPSSSYHLSGAGAAQPSRRADDLGAAGAVGSSDLGDLRALGLQLNFANVIALPLLLGSASPSTSISWSPGGTDSAASWPPA
jgi:hypothetical protein